MRAKISCGLITLMLAAGAPHIGVAQKRASSKSHPSKLKTSQGLPQGVSTPVAAPLLAREQETIDEINLARANPSAYLKFLEKFRQYYRGKSIHYPDGSELVSNEGVAALDEAIAFVRTLKPLPPLQLRAGMRLAAKDHVNDLATGRSGHKGSDGSSAGDRLSRYGTWVDSFGENIVYQSRSAREDVISLIIDDGTSTRGHRKNIFKPTFHVIGIALSPLLKPAPICVITFAGDFNDSGVMNNKKTNTPTPTKY